MVGDKRVMTMGRMSCCVLSSVRSVVHRQEMFWTLRQQYLTDPRKLIADFYQELVSHEWLFSRHLPKLDGVNIITRYNKQDQVLQDTSDSFLTWPSHWIPFGCPPLLHHWSLQNGDTRGPAGSIMRHKMKGQEGDLTLIIKWHQSKRAHTHIIIKYIQLLNGHCHCWYAKVVQLLMDVVHWGTETQWFVVYRPTSKELGWLSSGWVSWGLNGS